MTTDWGIGRRLLAGTLALGSLHAPQARLATRYDVLRFPDIPREERLRIIDTAVHYLNELKHGKISENITPTVFASYHYRTAGHSNPAISDVRVEDLRDFFASGADPKKQYWD